MCQGNRIFLTMAMRSHMCDLVEYGTDDLASKFISI